MGRRTIKQRAGKQWVEGKTFRLADEVRYMQRRAAEHASRIVTIGQLVLFSTETGDAWLLDPSDQLAAPLARDGDPFSVEIQDTDTSFTVAWKGQYRIDGAAFVYADNESGSIRAFWATLRDASPIKFQIWLASFLDFCTALGHFRRGQSAHCGR